MTYSFAPSNQPLYVNEGDYVQFRFKAPPSWNTTLTVTVQIGDLTQYWLITTIPEDFTPDPYPFQEISADPGAELDTLYTYADGTRAGENIVTVSGLTPTTQASIGLGCNLTGGIDTFAMRIDYNGDGTWDTGWIQGDGSEAVENGAKIQVRAKTQQFVQAATRLTLVIGTSNEVWVINTKPLPQNKPTPFPNFTDLVNQEPNIFAYTTEIRRIQGLTTTADFFITNNAEWAKSSNNNTTTNADGYEVLSGATFSGSNGFVSNGDYIQLRMLTSSNSNTAVNTSITIGDASSQFNDDGADEWEVETGNLPSVTPNLFFFPDKLDQLENAIIGSDERTIAGLSAGIKVPVTLISTNSTEAYVKINNGSVGLFPTEVENGDIISIYLRSSPQFDDDREMTIKVGNRQISTWTVITNSGPDYDATFNPPLNKTGQIPSTFVSSAPIVIEGINRPITIANTGGYNALISIDFDTPVLGPRTFDPAVNTSIYLLVFSADQLATPESTTMVIGTEADNVSAVTFTWSVTTYATIPPGADNLGTWYSKKTEKFDGYDVGTVIPILKEGVGGYGDLEGGLGSRYAGWIECDGRSVNVADYFDLYGVIEDHYGGDNISVSYNVNGDLVSVSGTFKLPDYRNRRLCGIGIVDSSRGNSAQLDITTSGGNINTPGSEGGFWYFDRVSVDGSPPLEQIQGSTEGSTEGTLSRFFSLGTVRIQGLETVTDSVLFSISGSVNAQIGPLQETGVNVPEHSHAYVTAVVEGDGGAPLIRWGTRALFGTPSGNPNPFNYNVDFNTFQNDPSVSTQIGSLPQIDPGDSGFTSAVVAVWNTWITSNLSGLFAQELARSDPNWTNLTQWITDNVPTNASGLATSSSNINSYSVKTTSYMVWFTSPISELSGTPLGGGGGARAGMIDTEASSFFISPSTSVAGITNTHSHIITENVVGNPNTDFSGGNVSGAGTRGAPFGSGLDGSNTGENLQVTFNQTELFMDMTEGTFEFTSSFKKPIPSVTMKAQRQVPILNPFHKAKYIIKAY